MKHVSSCIKVTRPLRIQVFRRVLRHVQHACDHVNISWSLYVRLERVRCSATHAWVQTFGTNAPRHGNLHGCRFAGLQCKPSKLGVVYPRVWQAWSICISTRQRNAWSSRIAGSCSCFPSREIQNVTERPRTRVKARSHMEANCSVKCFILVLRFTYGRTIQ
jgi:hypothetical protein